MLRTVRRRDLRDVLGFRHCDGESVAHLDVQHHVDIGAAVAGIDDVVRPDLQLRLQLVEGRYFSVAGGGAHQAFDLARGVVNKFGAVNVVTGNDPLESGLNHFHRGGGDYVEIEVIAIHSVLEHLVKQFDIFFQADVLADFVEMLLPHLLAELGIMQKQVRQFRPLLHQVQFGHALRLAFKFRSRNADQFTQYVAGIVESKGLVKVAGKKVTL